MARYRKLDPRFWRDEKIRTLDPVDKLIAVYAFSGQSNRIGCFTFSPGMAAEDTAISRPTFAERFRSLCERLNWRWDELAAVVYLPTWWKYNQPENPNVLVGNLRDLDDVPHSPLVLEFCDNVIYLDPRFHQTFRETLAKRYPKRSAVQEQEQKHKQESTLSSSPARHHIGAGNDVLGQNGFLGKAHEVLDYLNRQTGHAYRPVSANLDLIVTRLRSGVSAESCKTVIDRKVSQWSRDPKMAKYLRPATLFNRTKFEQYLGELGSARLVDEHENGRPPDTDENPYASWPQLFDCAQCGEAHETQTCPKGGSQS